MKKSLSEDISGQTIDNLTPLTLISRITKNGKKVLAWKCSCKCGNICIRDVVQLRNKRAFHSCGCGNQGEQSKQRRGYKGISGAMWSRVFLTGIKDRKIPYTLTIQEAWELYELQNKKCALTGLPIEFAQLQKDKNKTTASLDRIDSTKGYTKDNVQWVHKIVNIMKNILSQDQFLSVCKFTYEFHNLDTYKSNIDLTQWGYGCKIKR